MIKKNILYFLIILFTYSCAKPVTVDNVNTIIEIPEKLNNDSQLKEISTDENINSGNPIDNFSYMFNDENLNNLINEALNNSPDILILASKIRQARSEALIAGANLFPSISGGLDYSYGNSSVDSSSQRSNLNVSATFSWELDIFGKQTYNRKSAKERIAVAEKDLLSARISLISDVASYYFTIRNAALKIVIYKEILKNYQELLEVYKHQLEFGFLEVSDVIKAENEYFSAYNSLKSLEIDIEKNKNALLVLTGKEKIDFDLYDINYVMPKAKIPNIETIPTIAILNRPDVMGSINSLNAAIYSTFSSKSALYPTIGISGNIGQIIASSNGVGDLLWSITASLTAPLINRKELYETWRIKQEAEKQAELTLKKVISTAISEIEDSIFQLNANRKVYENSIISFKNSTEVMNFIEGKYKYGLLDIIELLKSKNEFYNSKISLNTAEFNEILSNINLYKAFGGSFGKPLDMVKYGTDY